MTLATTVLVKGPAPVEELFFFCQKLLDPNEQVFEKAAALSKIDGTWPNNPQFFNKPGQGLPALLTVEFGDDGVLVRDPQNEEDVDEDEMPAWKIREGCYIEITFDTGYSWESDGASCKDLHAHLVFEVGRWLEERGLAYLWEYEYEGEWYDSIEEVAKLGDREKGAAGLAAVYGTRAAGAINWESK